MRKHDVKRFTDWHVVEIEAFLRHNPRERTNTSVGVTVVLLVQVEMSQLQTLYIICQEAAQRKKKSPGCSFKAIIQVSG